MINRVIQILINFVSISAVLTAAAVSVSMLTKPAVASEHRGNHCPYIRERGLTCIQSCDRGIPNYGSDTGGRETEKR